MCVCVHIYIYIYIYIYITSDPWLSVIGGLLLLWVGIQLFDDVADTNTVRLWVTILSDERGDAGCPGYEEMSGVRGDVRGTRRCPGYEEMSGVRGDVRDTGMSGIRGCPGYEGMSGVQGDVWGTLSR